MVVSGRLGRAARRPSCGPKPSRSSPWTRGLSVISKHARDVLGYDVPRQWDLRDLVGKDIAGAKVFVA